MLVGAKCRNTARTFYAAGTFFDILNQFGDISEAVSLQIACIMRL